jgi:predicted acylesterase/phospholipase RssA
MTNQTELDEKIAVVKNSYMKGNLFSEAREELLKLRSGNESHLKLAQHLAICTYKDAEAAPSTRYAEALKILESIGLGSENCDPETLRLGGAVYRRKWQFDGRLENLHQAYSLYREAADTDPNDLGYGAINAAFILDLLTARARVLAKKTSTSLDEAERLAKLAKQLRNNSIKQMKQALADDPELASNTWFLPTLAEAHFGLGMYAKSHYANAKKYLLQTVSNGVDEWESKPSFRKLVSIAKAQGIQLPAKDDAESDWHPAWQALTAYLGEHTRTALECYRGRVGLALSGGGFRASFYHIGVLARLAEMDVLRSVEVLSTVSGGSIVGAHYYLEVQNLLKSKADKDIDRDDYIRIVQRVQKQFFAGVTKNLRMSIFTNPIHNIRLLFDEKYSRSQRIGALYEQDLYSNIGQDRARTDCYKTSRNMSDLLITPKDNEGGRFNPNTDNWRRRARAPVLLLNTTSLNSGHNWRFTAKWMGEPPGVMDEKIDKNSRYEWVDYGEKGARQVRLGSAVAASACVPGLFEPLELTDIYPGHTVKLVDGGVHDNQGVGGLLDEGCTLILCSDASGQMDSNANPSSSTLGVPLRSNEILMDRVREAQYQDLAARVDSQAIEGLFFTHLKGDLKVDLLKPGTKSAKTTAQTETHYGIHPQIQQKIAALRTDLDCFSEVEAAALMLSGYKMTQWQFNNLQQEHEASGEEGSWGDYDVAAPSQPELWTFLDADFIRIAAMAPIKQNPASEQLAQQLDIGALLFLKVFKAVKQVRYAGFALLAIIAIVGCVWIYSNWDESTTISVGGFILVIVLMLAALLWPAFKWFNPQSRLQNKAWLLFIGIVGAALSLVQVKFLDKLFLQFGELKKLTSLLKK